MQSNLGIRLLDGPAYLNVILKCHYINSRKTIITAQLYHNTMYVYGGYH